MFGWNPGETAWSLIDGMYYIWNAFVEIALSYLGMDLNEISDAITKEGASTSIVNALKTLEDNLFEPVACGLVVIFFLWKFFNETIEMRDNIKLEKTLMDFVKISLAQLAICNTREIVTAILQVGVNIIDHITGSSILNDLKMTINDSNTYIQKLADMKFFPSLFLFLVAFIATLVALGCSIALLYTVISRFMKIFILMPFGVLSFSTIVGGHEMSASAKAFIKHVFLIMLEGICIVLTLKISSIWSGINISGILSASGANLGNFKETGTLIDGMIWVLDLILPMMMTVGLVKGIQSLLSKALAL